MEDRRRIKTWSVEEELQFIKVWKDSAKELKGTKRNRHIYETMSKQLSDLGVHATGKEIQRKVNNLTQRYRKETNTMQEAGGTPCTWKLYQAVHSIVGSFAANDVTKTETDEVLDYKMDTSLEPSNVYFNAPSPTLTITRTSSPSPTVSMSPLSSVSSPGASQTKRKRSISEEILEEMKITNQIIAQQAKDIKDLFQRSLEIDKEMLALMRTLVSNSNNNN